MSHLQLRSVVIVGVICLTVAGVGQVKLTSLGTLPTTGISFAYGVNQDGTRVTGHCYGDGVSSRGFVWVSGQGLLDLGEVPGGHGSEGKALSSDGSVVVGFSYQAHRRPFRWTTEAMQDLGELPGQTNTLAQDVSGDGSIVVGVSGNYGFRWTEQDGMQQIGALSDGWASVEGISRDGQVLVGFRAQGAFFWTEAGGLVPLDTPGTGAYALDASADGSVIVGACRIDGRRRAFRWDKTNGTKLIQTLAGFLDSEAESVSADGSVVVGTCESGSGYPHAFVWSAETGPLDISAYLKILGVDLEGWILDRAHAVSEDGTCIVGSGPNFGADRAWLVSGLPPVVKRLAPVSESVALGKVASGGLDSLATDDGNPQVVCRFVVPSQSSPFISIQLKYDSPYLSPSSVGPMVCANWTTAGSYALRLLLRNATTELDEVVLPYSPLPGVPTPFAVRLPGSGVQFIDQATGEMNLRIQFKQTGVSAVPLPCVSLEYANIVVVP